jgi:hypothetical protein
MIASPGLDIEKSFFRQISLFSIHNLAKTKDFPPEDFSSKFGNKIDANFLHKFKFFCSPLPTRTHTSVVHSEHTKILSFFSLETKKNELKLKMRKNGEPIFYLGDSTRGSG